MAPRDALRTLLETVRVLTSHGFEAAEAVASGDPGPALVRAAADRLGPGTLILSRDPELARSDPRVVSPEALEARLHAPETAPLPLPFVDLASQQRRILPELERRISTVLRHGRYILGPEISELEERLAAFVGTRHAVCCSSGTDALLMALMACGIGRGDGVFTTPFTFIATAEAIRLAGATPIFVDIDPETFNLDPAALEEAVVACERGDAKRHPLPATAGRLRPRAILTVDLFGLPADHDRVAPVASGHGLAVIEDAAQSFGARYHGRRAGSLGKIGCTSFFPAKPLGCYGDGGAVFTDDDDLARQIVSIRVHGQGSDKYHNRRIGLNARMDTLQAAILLPKLEILPSEIEARNRAAQRYTERLSPHPFLRPPRVPEGLESAWAQYGLLADGRDRIRAALGEQGIPTAVYYPLPLHLQPAFSDLGYRRGDFPKAEAVAARIFSLPMHPYLAEAEIDRIAEAVARAGARFSGGG